MKNLHIAVGIICDTEKGIYITQRGESSHLAGYLEFPGGKVEPGETPEQALYRELLEEVGIETISPELLKSLNYSYVDKTLTLHFYMVKRWNGQPYGREGQLGRWVPINELDADRFPEANRPIVELLQLSLQG